MLTFMIIHDLKHPTESLIMKVEGTVKQLAEARLKLKEIQDLQKELRALIEPAITGDLNQPPLIRYKSDQIIGGPNSFNSANSPRSSNFDA